MWEIQPTVSGQINTRGDGKKLILTTPNGFRLNGATLPEDAINNLPVDILYGGGKMLIPRRTGILKEIKVQFTTIRRTSGIEKNEDFIHDKGSLIIPANQKVSILVDQTYETLGYPEMLVSGGKNAHIQAMYSENMIVKNHAPKGNRNDIEGKRAGWN